ncbi:MAG: hypothetical protein H8D65_01170 [Spirochaetes bacterium]|nr:hypothetical protein [Spirochaetota bacterium]MBL7005649.1 hypothetical protein [Spirochaetia bacterium]
MSTVQIISGFFLVIIVIILLIRYFSNKRTEALTAFAEFEHYKFSKNPDDTLLPSLSGFRLFSKGHAKKVSNVLRKDSAEKDLTIFDYRYTTGGGKSSHTWNQTVILYQSNRLQLPSFTLRPENVFHKIGKSFGYEDIDFDTHPIFSKQYLLRGEDEMKVRKLFTEKILSYFDEKKGFCVEGDGARLLFYRGGKKVPPQNIPLFQETGLEVFNLFKESMI